MQKRKQRDGDDEENLAAKLRKITKTRRIDIAQERADEERKEAARKKADLDWHILAKVKPNLLQAAKNGYFETDVEVSYYDLDSLKAELKSMGLHVIYRGDHLHIAWH